MHHESKFKINITSWTPIDIPSDSWVTAYELNNPKAVFRSSLFHLNSDNVRLRLVVNNVEVFEMDLGELLIKYKLLNNHGNNNNNEGNFNIEWPLFCYDEKHWCFNSGPMAIEQNLKIELKAKTGTKKLYRGMTWWEKFYV